MPAPSSPFKTSAPPMRARSHSPLPPAPAVPPKRIDLNSSTRSTDPASGSKITRRAFLCDVVVENPGEETGNLLAHLGQPLQPPSSFASSSTSYPTTPSRQASYDEDEAESSSRSWSPRKREEMEKRLGSLIEELVRTERSYLSRISVLKARYADPLRQFAKDKNTQIIPLYEAKNLFANIDQVVPASQTFLEDLERMWANGGGLHSVGDVCLKHLRDMTTFAPYRTYISKQDEVQKLFQDALRKFSGFSSFIDNTKYQTTGIGNIGLRELLMEPVQRIPRYTLLWQSMIKCMSPLSNQRAKLLEAVDIASRIAKCEPDAQTVRATVMYCLQRHVEDFPADFFSSKRDYIDSIDVDDIPVDLPTSPSGSKGPSHSRAMSTFSSTSTSTPSLASIGSSASSSQLPTSPSSHGPATLPTLHCTLFLFNDKLLIAKRQSSSVSGRRITGLDDVTRLVKSGGGVAVMDKGGAKKDKLSYRGIVDVSDVIASDVGNGDFHLFFERPPADQSDRWSSRPFRSYTTVHPPYSAALDAVAIKKDKLRFIQALWAAQAVARSKFVSRDVEPPRAMVAEEEIGLEAAGEVFGRAKCYWSVGDRAAWSTASRKAKIAVHIDEGGTGSDLDLNEDGGPVVGFRIQPISGGLCRFSHRSLADEEEEREVIQMTEVMEQIITIIHRHGVFRFRTSNSSLPATPSSTSHRLRPSMLNLDAISRNLFGGTSVSSRSQTSSNGDMFGTTASKFSKTSTSSGLSRSTTEVSRFSSTSSEAKRRSGLSTSSSPISAFEEEDTLPIAPPKDAFSASSPYKATAHAPGEVGMGQSEVDLNERLQLARKNSKSMAALSPRPSRRVDTRSQGELRRGRSQDRAGGMGMGLSGDAILETLSRDLEESSGAASMRYPTRLTNTGGISTTAPLRVRNRTPSPTRALQPQGDMVLPQIPTTSPINLRRSEMGDSIPPLGIVSSPPPIAAPVQSLSPRASQVAQPLSPRSIQGPRSPTIGGPRSPPPHGPRATPLGPKSPTARPLPSAPVSNPPAAPPPSPAPASVPTASVPSGIGSAHTRLRVVSNTPRRPSLGALRETVPLKPPSDENVPSPTSAQVTPTMLAKRQHSEDFLTPRKRSGSKSPLEPRMLNPSGEMDDLPSVPSLTKRSPIGLGAAPGSRRSSGARTPRKISTPSGLTPRKISAASVATNGSNDTAISGVSTATAGVEDVEMAEHADPSSALDASRLKVAESRANAKRLKMEILGLKKVLSKELMSHREGRHAGNTGSLPRSPQRRHMSRLLDLDTTGDGTGLPARGKSPVRPHAAAKLELEATVIEERVRGLLAVVERLEGNLRLAMGDIDSGRMLVGKVVNESVQKSLDIDGMRGQVTRAKEQQDLLRQQLAEAQIEVDTIYEAFNTELDGMFNDAQLPPTEAFETLRRDLEGTKAERNDLRLENMRLKRELEEANLKREQRRKTRRVALIV